MRPLVLGLVAVLAASARAQVGLPPGGLPDVGPPLLLRLEGVVQDASPAAVPDAFAVVSLGFTGSAVARRLAVVDARTVGGDQPLDGKDVLAMVAPFSPNLLVTGSPAIVGRLREAPAGTRVTVEGLVSRGSRTYYLRSLTLGAPGARRRPPGAPGPLARERCGGNHGERS